MSKKKHSKKFDFSSIDLLVYIWQKRLPLGIITGAAILFSTVASLLITPMYKSTVILFPAHGASISQILSPDNNASRYSIYELGEEEQAEKLLQVLHSNEIRDRIIDIYDLTKHYGFKPGSPHLKTNLANRYTSNITFKRTPYMSVMIQVMDKDPRIAAGIANDISDLTDTVFHRIIKQRALEAFRLVENEYQTVQASVTALEDSLTFYRKLGINDYETQAERYHEAYGKAIVEGNMNAARILEDKLKLLSRYGTQYMTLQTKLTLESSRLSQLNQRYSEARMESEQSIPSKFVVNAAEIPDKKAYPKKSIIVLVSAFSAFLFGLISLLIFDTIRRKYY